MRTAHNLIANVAGRLWSALMSFAFVPLYLRFLGIEAYGLIGFFASLLAMFTVLDLGLSLTINRELARLGIGVGAADDGQGADNRAEARMLVRSLEAVYWLIGVLMAAAIVIAAPWIARSWLRLTTLPVAEAATAIRLMGVVALLRWPVSLYTGAMMGMGRHVAFNLIAGICATASSVGAVLVLWQISPTPAAFFAWQVAAAAIQIVLLREMSWRYLALPGHRARPQVAALRSVVAFSAGVTATTLLSVILSQIDKALLSKMLPLDQFGYYSLASSIAMLLTTAAGALDGALFPALVRRVAAQDQHELARFYHQASEMVSALLVPSGVTLALFSTDFLTLYLRDANTVAHTHLLLSLFAVGNTLLALMIMPVALQLAHGWTSLTFYVNLVAVMVFVPLMLFLVSRFGASGAVIAWIVLTLGYLVVEVAIMHRRLLPEAQTQWYLIDIGVPILLSAVLIGGAWLGARDLDSTWLRAGVGCLAGGSAVLLSLLALPHSRAWLWARRGLILDRGRKSPVAG